MKKIGHITPSSNTVLEPVVNRLGAELGEGVSQHFTRLSVRAVALDAASDDQFALDAMLAAAGLLAEAPLDAIVWNGTAGSWRGSATDRRIAAAMLTATGIAATTSTLAIYATLQQHGWTRIALAVPYTTDVTQRIVTEYGRDGIEVVHSVHLGLVDNIAMGNVDAAEAADLVMRARHADAQCIAVVCTNVSVALQIAELEGRCGLPIVDSVAVSFAAGCRLAGVSPALRGRGYVLAQSV